MSPLSLLRAVAVAPRTACRRVLGSGNGALLLALVALAAIASAPAAHGQESDPVEGVRRLAERWLGERAAEVAFEFSNGSLSDGHDAFALLVIDGETRVYGESEVALARGLFEYMRGDVGRLPSWWSGAARSSDDALPLAEPRKGSSPLALRMYLEPEAFAYAAAFWDAPRWEREIDLAALRGFNAVTMPLGTDRVWTEVYRRLEIEPERYTNWSVGPAFRAFGWRGDAFGWMGPQSLTFAETDAAIARRVLSRMRELGVEPVLPAFTGVLPAAFAELFPDSTFFPLGAWAGLGDAVLLDPADPLFARLAELFYDEQERVVGRSSLYFGTPLGEGRSLGGDDAALARVGAGVGDALATWRDEAQLVLGAWPMRFDRGYWKDARIEPFVGAFASEQLLVLDRAAATKPLWNETDGFFGRDWIWGVTPTLGGRQRLGGPLTAAAEALVTALASEHPPIGASIAHEHPGTDPLRFEYLCDQLWATEPIEPVAWVESYVAARYGNSDPRAVRAWRRILATAYGTGVERGGPSPVVAAPSTLAPPAVPYDAGEVAQAWRELVDYAQATSPRPALVFDVIDVGRQVLSDAAVEPISEALAAWTAGDEAAFSRESALALEAMADLDELLATHSGFLLGSWLESASARGGDDVERASIVAGARALVTHFGPIGGSLRDWGGREWAGLVSAYHRERWRRLFEALSATLASGAAFDAGAFDAALVGFEREWAARANPYTAVPMGEPLATARALADTWVPELVTADAGGEGAAALVDESTPPLARWRIGEGAAVSGARLSSELRFAVFLREAFGVGFDLLEWRAEGWDSETAVGAREAVVANLGASPADVRALCAAAGLRLALVCGAGGYGADTQSERLRRRELERLASDLELGAIAFDARLGAVDSDAALDRTLGALRDRVPDLLVIGRGVEAGAAAALFASNAAAVGPWFATEDRASLFAHGHELARGRANERTTESRPVQLDGRPRWADALVWQSFGLAGVFGFDVEGAPWLLDDRDLVRFARLLELFDEQRELLAGPVTLASNTLADGAVARGDTRTQIVVVRNLGFEAVTVDLPVGPELGLDPELAYEARAWHPEERYLGRVPSGEVLPLVIEPFGCVLVGLSADGFDRPIVEGCDQLWIPGPEGAPRRVVMFAEPGSEVRVRLHGDTAGLTRASVDGVGVDALLEGRELRLSFDGPPTAPERSIALGPLESEALPSTTAQLVGAARASMGSNSSLSVLESRAPSGFAEVERARRLARADLEELDGGANAARVLQSTPTGARRLRVRLPEGLAAGRSIAVTVTWAEGATPSGLAVAARIPERGLVGARSRFGPTEAPTYLIDVRPEDAGREIDLWVLHGGEGAPIAGARAWLRAGRDQRSTRTLVLE